MLTEQGIYIGLAGEERVILPLNMANRHGLITGASGTGKTVTMKVLAEDFSDAGVPVFLCDVKGDVSGLAVPGTPSEKMDARIEKFGIWEQFSCTSYPVVFWDVFQEEGHPVRATVSDMGPDLLSRLLRLTAAQEGVLNLVFRIADDHGLLLIDLKDLRTTLQFVAENRTAFSAEYGAIAPVTLQGILRALTPLETQGGDLFFGEPALDILDWMRTDRDGRGVVNLLDCVKLCRSPGLYAAFLLWMLSELFERLPEAGDLDKPKLVFFFDEAHMLFRDAPKALVEKIEQLVRLIRSKGVGVYFVTQSPTDLPDTVLSQLSHRVQHALRAYTPAEQKAVRAAASSLRPNPAFQAEDVISALGVGEALISVLDENGVPGMVQRASILCPRSLMAPADGLARNAAMASDGMEKYDLSVDNVSAYETLQERKTAADQAAAIEAERAALERERAALEARRARDEEAERKRQEKEAEAERRKQEREEEAARRKQEREEEYERRRQEREEEAARRKQERDEALLRRKLEQEQAALDRKLEQERKKKEQEQRRKEAAADRRRAQIENTLISTGGQVLRRGLMNTLYGKK